MRLSESIRMSVQDRFWQWRILLLPWLAYMGWRHLQDTEYCSPFEWLDVVIHEVGHPLFGYFGEFMHVAGGTLLQLIMPVAVLIILLRQGEFFGIPLCGVWFADNLYDVARYIADARAQNGEYVTLGINTGEPVEATHDWEYLLEHFNALEMDTRIGAWVRAAAFCMTWGSIAVGFWLTWVMMRSKRKS